MWSPDPEKARDQMRRNHARWKMNHPASWPLRKSKDRAKEKGLDFDLTKDWIEERLVCCAVTGLPFVHEVGTAKRANPWSPSIDRRDSSKGYTQDNCRVVVWIYNVAKSAWTDEDVMKMVEALYGKRN